MKTYLIILFVVANMIARTNPILAQEMSKQDYLELSKSQKTTAWVLLGGGAVVGTAGYFIGRENFCVFNCSDSQDNALNAAAIMVLVGGGSMIASIPVFVKSGNTAKKAAELSFKNQPMNIPRYTQAIPRTYPSITLSLPLR